MYKACFTAFDYSVPDKWYEGLYTDLAPVRKSARSFRIVHENRPAECWLLIHGYRGYPGEMVRPATDLYEEGFDVFVPRLPGHGTSGDDFIRTGSSDWMGVVEKAVGDLKTRYDKVNIAGHSMGSAMAAIIGCGDGQIGKIVYICPSFENAQMPLPARIALRVCAPFTPRLNCRWHQSRSYHLHYEDAPCDDSYLGHEYWTWYFTRQLPQYYRIMKRGLKAVGEHPHEHLVICPGKDRIISIPSLKLYRKAVRGNENVVMVENGTHCIMYDKDPDAEEKAIRAIVDFARGECGDPCKRQDTEEGHKLE